jgi:lipopolysaccharide transport system ATP-binding protein
MSRVISVEGLSKKFALRHQAGGGSYSTFRDVLAQRVRRLGGKLIGRSSGNADSTEEFWALRDIAFDIREGEKVGIIGRNGAGKSTLLKVLSRILEPTRGRIRIRGRVASLLEVGTGFHPELTGRENIFFNGSILGMTRAEIRRRFDDIVAFADVEKFLDTPVKHYSSGMYVRLGFAVAAHLEPEILIVDEVLAVGDAQFQKKCLGKLQEIGRQGRTVMFVSHNMSSILQFTERTIVLQGGRVCFDGESEAGVSEYLKLNESAGKASNLSSRVPWLRMDGLAYDQRNMQIGFNKPLRFNLDIALERDISEMVVNLGIFNSIGARIITAKASLADLPRGGHGIMLEIPEHRLIPGTYFISLVLSVRGEMVFSGEQLISIELLADDIDDPLLVPHLVRGKDRLGCYCPMRAEWRTGSDNTG